MQSVERVILNRDNEFALFLLEDGSPLTDLSGISKIQLIVDDTTVDSSVDAGTITWDETATWRTGVTRPVVKFFLGPAALLTAGTYRSCRVITFDVDHTNGLEWTRDLTIEVLS